MFFVSGESFSNNALMLGYLENFNVFQKTRLFFFNVILVLKQVKIFLSLLMPAQC